MPSGPPQESMDSPSENLRSPQGMAILRIIQILTVLVGAFLIFQIQPMVGKIVTPIFGGTSAVWTCCLLFFQFVVLGGYLLTFLISKLQVKHQALFYGGGFILSAFLLSIKAPRDWEAGVTEDPFVSLLVILVTNLVVQCVLLSSVSGMMQLWYRLTNLSDPYWMYAASNIGSIGALVTYPILIEPNLSLSSSISIWNYLYAFTALLILASAIFVFQKGERREELINDLEGTTEKPKLPSFLYWCFLTSISTLILICYTQHLTQDIAPIPLFWTAPLILYLLSYIICFARESLCKTNIFLIASAVLWILEPFLWHSILLNTACILGFVFFTSMAMHGELVRSKPGARHLATFYLALAIGGVAGGLFANLVAPMVFDFYGEKAIVFVVIILMSIKTMTRNWLEIKTGMKINIKQKPDKFRFALGSAFVMLATLIGGLLIERIVIPQPSTVSRMRNFYGCVSVERSDDFTSIVHGRVIHGTQHNDQKRLLEPTKYFVREGGFGCSMRIIRTRFKNLKAAVLGLGAGTIACYGEVGDRMTFFEIDPSVIKIANNNFSFLKLTKAANDVILGDGRLELEKMKGTYNLIIMDAFNGNAVPVHLLTREAFTTYLSHLTSDGFILVNISNRHINLEPVVGNLARKCSLHSMTLGTDSSTWILMSREEFAPCKNDNPRLRISKTITKPSLGDWTDDYSNVLSTLINKR